MSETTDNNVAQLLNSVRLARDNAEQADNRIDHSFYYALSIALEELQEHRRAAALRERAEPVAVVLDSLCVAFIKHAKLAGLSDNDSVTLREATDVLLHCAEQLKMTVPRSTPHRPRKL
ncbi:hypothetical protein ACMUBS_000575 [Cronobacter turicensis]